MHCVAWMRSSLTGDAHDVVLERYLVRRKIVESGRVGCGAIAQFETRMMPRTADGFPYKDSIRERRAVMRALRADSEPVRLDVSEENRFAEGMAGDHLARPNTADLDPLGEVGTSQFIRMFAHFRL